MRKIYGMYFSGTDTTKKTVEFLADRLSRYLQGEKRIYDFTLPGARKGYPEFTEDDIVIFGTPVIAGRVPNVLLPYLKTIRGNGAAAVPVVLYGNRNYDDALIELRDLLEAGGFRTMAAGAFIGEHTFSEILAAGRPDQKDMETAGTFARQYTGICMKCGACIKKCPHHARYYDDEGYLYHKKELEEMYERWAEPEIFLL